MLRIPAGVDELPGLGTPVVVPPHGQRDRLDAIQNTVSAKTGAYAPERQPAVLLGVPIVPVDQVKLQDAANPANSSAAAAMSASGSLSEVEARRARRRESQACAASASCSMEGLGLIGDALLELLCFKPLTALIEQFSVVHPVF